MKPIKCKPSNLVRNQPNLKEKTWKEKKNLGEEKKRTGGTIIIIIVFLLCRNPKYLVSFVIVMLSK
jgi:hypothetical protein